LRRAMLQCLATEGAATGRGYKRLWHGIIADVFGDMPEAEIKRQLFSFLQCYDITPEERAEVVRLLQSSSTALTEDQRRQLDYLLQAE